jgi:cyclophilin family peptidyl-prolyl cis-trans isomerase
MEQYSDKQRQDFEDKLAKAAQVKKKAVDLDEFISVEDFLAERRERKDWRHERHTTGQMANSVTSTYIDLKTSDEKRALSDLEMLGVVWMEIKSFHHKTYLQLQTNLGEMNVELFSDQAVRTCYSFLELVYKGLLAGMKFKRLVPGSFLQMENALSRTLKLDTVDRSEKLFHKKPYLLTVDTLGGLNTFGITLAEAALLDRTNSVFGQVMTNQELLDLVDQAGEEDGLPNVASPDARKCSRS